MLGFEVVMNICTTEDILIEEVPKYSGIPIVMLSCLTGFILECADSTKPIVKVEESMRKVCSCLSDLVLGSPGVKVFIGPPLPNPEVTNYLECSSKAMVYILSRFSN